MSYDEVDLEDMDWNEELQAFTYQCPCGDLFQITTVSPSNMSELPSTKAYHAGRKQVAGTPEKVFKVSIASC